MKPRTQVPQITHLQFAILDLLTKGETAGHGVRDALAKQGDKRSGPSFYQLMARMEDAGLVTGRYFPKIVGEQVVKERRYKLTATGRRALESTLEFYLQAQLAQGGLVHARG